MSSLNEECALPDEWTVILGANPYPSGSARNLEWKRVVERAESEQVRLRAIVRAELSTTSGRLGDPVVDQIITIHHCRMFDVRAEVFFEFIEDWPRASTRPERMEWLDRELQHYKEQFCQEQFFDDEDEHGVWTRYWIDLPAETLAERERALLHRIAFWMEKAKEKLDHVQGKEPIENPADVPDGRRARATLISEKKLKAIEARIVEWRGWDTYAHLTDKEIEAKAFKEEKLSDSVIAQHLGIARKSVYDRRQSADRKLNRAFNTYGKRR